MSSGRPYKFDIFLRYHRAQSRWARQLAERLDREGCRVWFDQWMLQPGSNRKVELRRAIDECRFVALLLSEAFVTTPWPRDELYSGFPHAPASQNQRLLPLIYEPCELPKPVESLPAIDFTGSEDDPIVFEFQAQQLLALLLPDYKAPKDLQRFRLQHQRSQSLTEEDEELGLFQSFVRNIQTLIAQIAGREAEQPSEEGTKQIALLQFLQRLFQWNTADLQFEKGEEWFARDRFQEALAAYDRALNIDPNFATAWSRRGDTLVQLRRYREAIDSYNGSLAINPYDEVVRLNLAQVLGQMGRYKSAVVNYDKVLDINPEEWVAWHNRGLRLAQLGRLKLALKSLDRALELQPKSINSWIARGFLQRALKQPKGAIASYAKALDLAPKQARIWRAQGNALLLVSSNRRALVAYNTSLKLQPQSAPTWHNRGILLLRLGRYRDAVANFDRAYTYNPDSYKTWHARGTAFQALGLWKEARIHYEEALKIQPNYYPALYALAVALAELGKDSAAIAKFDRVLQARPKSLIVLYGKAMALRRLGQWKEAIATCKRMIGINERDAWGWFALGITYSDAGDLEGALDSYERTLTLNPKDATASNNRAWILCRLERYAEAEQDAIQATQQEPSRPGFWHTLGTVQAGLERVEEAIASYGKVLELDPDFAPARQALELLQQLATGEPLPDLNRLTPSQRQPEPLPMRDSAELPKPQQEWSGSVG
jgi:tetratricopeptide (TPR) repeat protein